MAMAARDVQEPDETLLGLELVCTLVLARLVSEKSVTQAELSRDVHALVAHRLSPAEFRELALRTLADLGRDGYVELQRGRYALTPTGQARALGQLGVRKAPADWGETRDVLLVAKALGVENPTPRQLKALSRPDGLRAAIVVSAFKLKAGVGASPARIRGQLAVVALERAFGNKIKSSMDEGAGLPAKMSRMLAAQLLRKPRELGTDARLLAALSAECVAATRPTIDAIRLAVLRSFVQRHIGEAVPNGKGSHPNPLPVGIQGAGPGVPAAQAPSGAAGSAPSPRSSRIEAPLVRPAAANRPDLTGFVQEVHRSAAAHAEGWPGSRKSFICHVWREIAARFPEWGLSEIEFKGMLAEAHRTGHLTLVNADLRDKRNLPELQASAISYKNTVWHYVRLQD